MADQDQPFPPRGEQTSPPDGKAPSPAHGELVKPRASRDARPSTGSGRAPSESEKKSRSGWVNLLVDYGPLLVFFLTYRLSAPEGEDTAGEILAVIHGTGAFIVAALVALAVSRWRLGKVSPMLWLSTALIVGFGALTIYFQDERFIQWKPTIIYLGFGIALLVGWRQGKALLKTLLEAAFDGLNDEGWLKLSRNWGLFFLFLAVLNTVLLYALSFEAWLASKLWLFMPLSFLFTFTQLPMLLRHGLMVEAETEALQNPPVE